MMDFFTRLKKQYVILPLFMLVLVLVSQAKPVDEATAKSLAENFWMKNYVMGVMKGKVVYRQAEAADFRNVAANKYENFYIFSNEKGKGFVIIAADDCVTPILGYSYENDFEIEGMPENITYWLNGYEESIRIAIDLRTDASEEVRQEWQSLYQNKRLAPKTTEAIVNPLVKTKWDQSPYYNDMCPNNAFQGRTLTGCVATAMAQVMKYWAYPAHGYGQHSYHAPYYGTQSANFANTTYQWNQMPNSLSGPNNAVATLMYHCGVSVEMNYGVFSGSGAQIIADNSVNPNYNAENALKTFFGYSLSINGVKRSNYTDSQWISMLKTELNAGRPVIYGGSGADGGHCFICDGYDTGDRFSFNWGWGGLCDGNFFTLNNLKPVVNVNGEPHEFDYSNNQIAVIGIQPSGDLNTFKLQYYDDLVTDDEYEFCEELDVYAEVVNRGNANFNGYLAPAAFYDDEDGYLFVGIYGYWDCSSSPIQPNHYVYGSFEQEGCAPYIPGLYDIYMIYSMDGGDTWLFVEEDDYGSTDFEIICSDNIIVYSSFSVKNNNGIIYSGRNSTINVDIANVGSHTFYGKFGLCLADESGLTQQLIQTINCDDGLGAGYHYNNGLNFTGDITVQPGIYLLSALYQEENESTWYVVGSDTYFNPVWVYVSPQCLIDVFCNPSGSGTITGAGLFVMGETCTLKATPNTSYVFEKWTDEFGNTVSTNSTYSFTVADNRRLFACMKSIDNVLEETSSVNIYPNPTKGTFTIEVDDVNNVVVFDICGQKLIEKNVNGNAAQIDLNGFAKGQYVVQISTENSIITKKIIKE